MYGFPNSSKVYTAAVSRQVSDEDTHAAVGIGCRVCVLAGGLEH